ncbi:LpqB family beta-propeller domain-containing protein [Streptomonospora wellingtoniae]|uniref:LpqB family beta-propeller domain-containing protein n=1 Tax=Streptomonospora wellingtoniae TaxID=3075544 RepID=A0ABU2KQR2_9ACTN|nr:LpqB family beta-propeller domain-containing protein [Streptomonospora sp. DSM 45055]MDT0301610.1 LpqB family beta-propeller domain-containing protein [Streptomonospora sp. DSM 45055]
MTTAHSASPGRTRRAGAAAALLALGLSACATVPSGGPVVEGEGGAAGSLSGSGYVRQIPPGPQRDVEPNGLVRGFLKSMASFEENHSAAREYLAPKTRSDWLPSGRVLVYEDSDKLALDAEVADDGETAQVRLLSSQLATIDASGQYTPAGAGQVIDVTLDLVRTGDDQWRISDPPELLVLSRSDVDLVYRPLNLYFFNRDRSTLVPDAVFLPVSSDRSATRLVKMLVAGPTSWLDDAVESAFPKDATADVAYDSGTVTVEVDNASGGTTQRFGMRAQLVWTLRQLPEVQELRLRVGGLDIDIPADESENLHTGEGDWDSVNPAGVTGSLRAYFVRDGRMWALESDSRDAQLTESRVAGAPGAGQVALEQHAVSLDEDRVGGIRAGGKEVVVAGTSEGSDYTAVLSGGDYTSLSWDGYGNLWVAEDVSTGRESDDDRQQQDSEEVAEDTERGDPSPTASPSGGEAGDVGTRVWMLRGGTDPVEVDAPELAESRVTALRMSRDGTRAAVLSSRGEGLPRLAVGRVVHSDAGITLSGEFPLATELQEITDVAWRGGDQLAVVGHVEQGAEQSYLVALDGSTETTSAGAPPGTDMGGIAAAPGLPLLSGTEDDNVWMTDDRINWKRVGVGTNPVYPG